MFSFRGSLAVCSSAGQGELDEGLTPETAGLSRDRRAARLHAVETAGDEVLSGLLTAPGRRYPIRDGVPCFLDPQQRTASRQGFNDMWRYRRQGRFEQRGLYGMRPERRAGWLAGWYAAPFAAGAWVLDAGCGSAELTRALAERYPDTQFVGVELSEEVRMAARTVRSLHNLHLVQADLMAPPFRRRAFARLFSLGVLHHTPDTRAALARLAPLLAPGGELVCWIYPTAWESPLLAPLYLIRDLAFGGRGHRLPAEWRLYLSRLWALGLLPSAAAAYRGYQLLPGQLGIEGGERLLDEDLSLRDLYDAVAFCLYDNITPEHQFRHCQEEVLSWFPPLGFAALAADGHGTYWGRRRGEGAGSGFTARSSSSTRASRPLV